MRVNMPVLMKTTYINTLYVEEYFKKKQTTQASTIEDKIINSFK